MMLNLVSQKLKFEDQGSQENKPEFVTKIIVIPQEDGTENEVSVNIGSTVTDNEGAVIPDGKYEVKDEDLLLVITDGKPELVAKTQEPSADPQEVKVDDVEVVLDADSVQDAIDDVVNADINAEGATDATAEEVEQNVAVEAALAEIQSTISDLQSRIEALEAKLSESEAKVAEKEQEVADLKTELSAVKSVTPTASTPSNPYQQFANLFN